MVPRLKPALGTSELWSALALCSGSVEEFESAFARTLGARAAVAFPYGRSGLWAILRALGIDAADIVLPAYTCSVVAHAVVLSGNVPRFVDCSLQDYNMDLDQLEAAVSDRTGAIVATHLFGYPLDLDRLEAIVRAAEARVGKKIWVIHDCAHSFGARWKGRLVSAAGDAALFGLNVSKLVTSVFGGMVTLGDPALEKRLREFRTQAFRPSGAGKDVRRLAYLLAVYPAFQRTLYGVIDWLDSRTSVLDPWTKAYHLDAEIRFPPDYDQRMSRVEARVGQAQLAKYESIVAHRVRLSRRYDERLRDRGPWILPPRVEGATYSHYVLRVQDRTPWLAAAGARGIQLGQLIDYSVPELPGYRSHRDGEFAHARLASHSLLNLPIHSGVSDEDADRIAAAMIDAASARG